MKRRLLRSQWGSTLIELMTVSFIILGMASMIVPNIYRAIWKSKLTGCISNIRNIVSVLEQYRNEHEEYPETLTHLVPTYLGMVPTCPQAKRDTYTGGYEVSDDRTRFTLCCKGRNHTELGLPPDQPYWSHEAGGLKFELDLEISGNK